MKYGLYEQIPQKVYAIQVDRNKYKETREFLENKSNNRVSIDRYDDTKRIILVAQMANYNPVNDGDWIVLSEDSIKANVYTDLQFNKLFKKA